MSAVICVRLRARLLLAPAPINTVQTACSVLSHHQRHHSAYKTQHMTTLPSPCITPLPSRARPWYNGIIVTYVSQEVQSEGYCCYYGSRGKLEMRCLKGIAEDLSEF